MSRKKINVDTQILIWEGKEVIVSTVNNGEKGKAKEFLPFIKYAELTIEVWEVLFTDLSVLKRKSNDLNKYIGRVQNLLIETQKKFTNLDSADGGE